MRDSRLIPSARPRDHSHGGVGLIDVRRSHRRSRALAVSQARIRASTRCVRTVNLRGLADSAPRNAAPRRANRSPGRTCRPARLYLACPDEGVRLFRTKSRIARIAGLCEISQSRLARIPTGGGRDRPPAHPGASCRHHPHRCVSPSTSGWSRVTTTQNAGAFIRRRS